MKIIVFLAHFSLQDGPCSPSAIVGQQLSDSNATLSDHLLHAVLQLLKKEVSEHGRHLTQYFHLFLMYANLGIAEVIVRIIFCVFMKSEITVCWSQEVPGNRLIKTQYKT